MPTRFKSSKQQPPTADKNFKNSTNVTNEATLFPH